MISVHLPFDQNSFNIPFLSSLGARVLDLVVSCRLSFILRRVFRGWSRLHPMDDHRRAV